MLEVWDIPIKILESFELAVKLEIVNIGEVLVLVLRHREDWKGLSYSFLNLLKLKEKQYPQGVSIIRINLGAYIKTTGKTE